MVTSFNGRKSQQKRNSPFFFFNITMPLAQGVSEGCIIPKASRFRSSWLARSAFSGDILRAPSRCGTAPGSSSTGCLAMVQRPMLALCFVNKSSNSLRILPRDSQALAPYRFLTSCNCESGPGIGTISSGSVRLRISRSESPASLGSVEDKNSNSDEEVNSEAVDRFISLYTL